MSVIVANSRFITSSMPRFYQQILKGVVNFQELGNRIVKKAESAFYLRQVDSLKEFGSLLSNLPIKEYQLIGQYYLGLCEYYNGANETQIFENVLENSTTYKPKALMSLAAIEARKENYASEAYYFAKAMKYADSITTIIKASKSIAIVKAKEGFHKSAIKDLENLIPVIKYAEPFVYFNFLNSYAVELYEVGRTFEAQNVCKIVLASPFVFAYPEWRETGRELALRGYKSRSSVPIIKSIPRISRNVLFMPEYEASEGHRRSPFDYPRGVTKMADWKKKMVKEPNGEKEFENVDEMNDKDLLATLIQLAAREDIDEEKLRDVVKYAIKILVTSKRK